MSTEQILMWTYIIGFVATWRHHVGVLVYMDCYDRPSGSDFAFGLGMGTLCTLLWPFTVSGRVIYILWRKYGEDNTDALGGFFPDLKEVESRREKQQRIEREKKDQLRQRERDIEARERELGIGR